MCGGSSSADYAYFDEVVPEATPEVPDPEPVTEVTLYCEGCAAEVEEALRQALIPIAEAIPGHANVQVACTA